VINCKQAKNQLETIKSSKQEFDSAFNDYKQSLPSGQSPYGRRNLEPVLQTQNDLESAIDELKPEIEPILDKIANQRREEFKKNLQADRVGSFHEGRAWVMKGDKVFHIDKNGQPAYSEQYDIVGGFHEGRAWIRKGDKWFHIDRNGQPAYSERYDAVAHFQEGLAWVKKGDKYFHINRNGQPAYSEQYDGIDDFHEGRALVRKGVDEFYIDRNGKRIE